MFGQHDDKPKDDENHEDHSAVTTDTDQVVKPDDQATDTASRDTSWQPPKTPLDENKDTDDKPEDFSAGQSPAADTSDDTSDPLTPASMPDFTPSTPAADSNDLIDIKQEALGKLSPLIGHLDQSPDEKFRTLMMMIQASDDQSLVKQAYDTALDIDDEKTRAQALLDIVNEINYFTQNPTKSE